MLSVRQHSKKYLYSYVLFDKGKSYTEISIVLYPQGDWIMCDFILSFLYFPQFI